MCIFDIQNACMFGFGTMPVRKQSPKKRFNSVTHWTLMLMQDPGIGGEGERVWFPTKFMPLSLAAFLAT